MNKWQRFDKRLWQRNYYEHVVRNEIEHQAIADYIFCNPQNWEKDSEYPH
jgi:REP element-mobilizing transposase RayT